MEKINLKLSGKGNLENSVENALYMAGYDFETTITIPEKEIPTLDIISSRMFHCIMTSHPTDNRNWLELSYLERMSIETRKYLEDKAEWQHIDSRYWS